MAYLIRIWRRQPRFTKKPRQHQHQRQKQKPVTLIRFLTERMNKMKRMGICADTDDKSGDHS